MRPQAQTCKIDQHNNARIQEAAFPVHRKSMARKRSQYNIGLTEYRIQKVKKNYLPQKSQNHGDCASDDASNILLVITQTPQPHIAIIDAYWADPGR
jgi:hypothetical protein